MLKESKKDLCAATAILYFFRKSYKDVTIPI